METRDSGWRREDTGECQGWEVSCIYFPAILLPKPPSFHQMASFRTTGHFYWDASLDPSGSA